MRFEANQVLQEIAALKAAHPDIWDDDDEKLLSDCLQAETGMDEFFKFLIDRVQEAKAFAGSVVTRIAEMELRLDRYERREKALRALAFKIMTAAGIQKREFPEATLSIVKGRPKLVGNADPKELPDDLCIIKREPNRVAIMAAITAGDYVAGYQVSNSEPHLTIRTR